MKLSQLKELPGFLLLLVFLLWPYIIVVAFWVFVVVGAWKGWTK